MKNKKRTYIIFIFVLLLLPCIALLYAYIEARSIKLKEINLSHKEIPNSFIGKKIIFISDIHCDKYFTPKRVRNLVQKVNERNPDLILLGGDYTRKASTHSKPFFEEIANLRSKHGVFSVLGNHDHWEDAELIQTNFKKNNFNICDNQSYWIKEGNDSIRIGGVGDFWEDVQLLDYTINDVEDSDFCILLSHNPDYMEELDSNLVDFVLSGHTHAGQVTLFGLWAPVMPSSMHPEYMQTGQKYRYGWTKKNETQLYVTSGIGMGGFPFRFFANPEIVEFTLTK